jgi:hypothetical protein
MEKITKKQIEVIKNIERPQCEKRYFHGNTKKINDIPVNDWVQIIEKKIEREKRKNHFPKPSILQKFKMLLEISKKNKNTNYYKTLIEGHKNIYFASPISKNEDYNKSIFCEKNEKTIKLIELFNKMVQE